jgi:hypothetical protein
MTGRKDDESYVLLDAVKCWFAVEIAIDHRVGERLQPPCWDIELDE